MYDIQKETKYKNIIILVDDTSRINLNDFCFGLNQVILIQDSKENREKLKYLNSINWNQIIEKYYKKNIYLSEYSFCDYTDYKNKYISYFYFLDAEKINRIKYFLRENQNKKIEIICPEYLKDDLSNILPNANLKLINTEEFINKEPVYYD